jgi:hypothetical protein
MADFNITPIGNTVKPVAGMSLSDMMNMASSAQAYQQAQQINPLNLQAAQQTVEQARQMNPLLQQAQQQIVGQAARVNPELLRSATAAAGTAETGQASANLDFANKKVTAVANRLTSLIMNPVIIAAAQNPEAVNQDAFYGLIKNYGMTQAKEMGIPEDQAIALLQPYLEVSPAAMQQFLKDKLLGTIEAGSRLSAMQPTGVPVSSGAGTAVVSTGEFGATRPGAALPGTAVTTQLPPTQTMIAVEGDGTGLAPGTQYLKGPQAGTVPGSVPMLSPASRPVAPAAMAPPVVRPAVTGQAPGVAQTLISNATTANEDWSTTSKDASTAQQRIMTLQKIRQLAPEAFTGVLGQRKELIAGVANAIGIPAYEAEKTATDELMKNSNLLSLAGGNTDAARMLAEAANPNKKMNERAIKEVVGQLIGMENMKSAKAQYLGQYRNDPNAYIQKLANFNDVADSRLFQEMTREEVAKLKASMSPAEQKAMIDKIRKAKLLGVIK